VTVDRMKRLLLFALMAGAGACKAGEGKGNAVGSLYVLGCNGEGKDYGSAEAPRIFDLKPSFFAAEPIEEGDRVKVNALIIRMQPTGRSREINDVLTFNVPDSREVARCVRARVVNGKPDYDQGNCMQGQNGPRLRVAPDALIRAFLSPDSTCVRAVVGTAIDDPQSTADWDSWIELTEFGTAAQAMQPAESRQAIGVSFKVDINEPLVSPGFVLKLVDDAVVRGARSPAAAVVGGTLEGDFDFTLQRGQGAQTFP
jgi:hypothetical protein